MSSTRDQLSAAPFTAVHFFVETDRTAILPHIYPKLEETGNTSAFDLIFVDPAKWTESASYLLATCPDTEPAGLVEWGGK